MTAEGCSLCAGLPRRRKYYRREKDLPAAMARLERKARHRWRDRQILACPECGAFYYLSYTETISDQEGWIYSERTTWTHVRQ